MLFVHSWLGQTWLTVLPNLSLLPRWPWQELMQKEVEYVSISRDTTESDLKQRREILDGTAKYIHQVCVCASILLLSKLYSCLHLFVPFGFCTNHCPLLPSSLPSPPSPPLPLPPLSSPAAECCKGCFGRPPAHPGGDREGREECTACAEQSPREQRDAVGGRSLPCGTRKIRQAGQGTVHSKSILPSISLHE